MSNVQKFYGQDARGVLCVRATDYATLEAEYNAIETKCASLGNSLMAVTTRHFAESWTKRTSDAELEQYLSAGIAQLEAECERLRLNFAEYNEAIACYQSERDTLRQQRDKLAGLLRHIAAGVSRRELLAADVCAVIDAALAELKP